MAKYRRKPTIVEAEQWFPGKRIEGVYQETSFPVGLRGTERTRYFVITIHEQRAYLMPGDYILPEPDGVHHYPVGPDIFESTYETVPEYYE